jgi:DNA-binding Lrp family transcriptional regulator
MIELDRTTRRLIDALQRKGRQSAQALAEAVGMSATPVWRRLKELEQSG